MVFFIIYFIFISIFTCNAQPFLHSFFKYNYLCTECIPKLYVNLYCFFLQLNKD